MSPRLPRINADDIIRVLEKTGFALSRQSGSHKIYRNSAGKRVTVPYHKGKILHPRLLTSILKDANLGQEDLHRLLED